MAGLCPTCLLFLLLIHLWLLTHLLGHGTGLPPSCATGQGESHGGHVSGVGKDGPSMEVAAIPWPWVWVIHPLSGREREESRVRIDSTAGLGCFSINMSSYQQQPHSHFPSPWCTGESNGSWKAESFPAEAESTAWVTDLGSVCRAGRAAGWRICEDQSPGEKSRVSLVDLGVSNSVFMLRHWRCRTEGCPQARGSVSPRPRQSLPPVSTHTFTDSLSLREMSPHPTRPKLLGSTCSLPQTCFWKDFPVVAVFSFP